VHLLRAESVAATNQVLPPPKRLGAAEELWHELVIVRGHLPVIVRGLVPSPTESRKVTLVKCSCH